MIAKTQTESEAQTHKTGLTDRILFSLKESSLSLFLVIYFCYDPPGPSSPLLSFLLILSSVFVTG